MYVMHEASCRGVKTFFLEVRASNTAAQQFYEKAGFIKAGLRKAYYTDTRRRCRPYDYDMPVTISRLPDHDA